jgi:predicted RNA-binding Zn ribbon-like protein
MADPIWLELLNSDWHDYHGSGRSEDRLDDPGWLRAFASRWQLPSRVVSSRAARERLRAARTVMRRIVDALAAGRSPAPADLAALNCLYSAPVVRKLKRSGTSYRWCPASRRATPESLAAGMAVSFAEVLVHGEPSRIKICQNPDCLWVIYDRSRNRSRRWCDVTECGNLIRVRRSRERARRPRRKTHGTSD